MSLINVGICKNLLGSLKRASPGLLELQNCQQVRWASKKQGGSTRNRGGSQPKMLGVKLYGGQACEAGNIIVRQRGTKLKPGAHVGMGRDHTIYALQAGRVVFSGQKKQKFVNVEPRQ